MVFKLNGNLKLLHKQANIIEAVSFQLERDFDKCLKVCLNTNVVGKCVRKSLMLNF